MYPNDEVPVTSTGVIDEAVWPNYEKTVRDGTYWGANITGGSGGKSDVLALMRNPTSGERARVLAAVGGRCGSIQASAPCKDS